MPNSGLPEGWQREHLGRYLRLRYGMSLPESARDGGSFPVVGSAGVVGTHSVATVEGPGIVVGRKGSIGQITWLNGDFWPIDTTYYVEPLDGKCDLRWAYQLLQTLNLKGLNRATGIPGLNRDDVHALTRPVPPLDEQRRIAEVLDSIDAAIEKTEAVIAATERLRSALLTELLTRGVPGWHAEWKQVPGIGTIPACWDAVRLGEVADVQTGRQVGKAPGNAASVVLPYLSVANVKDGYLHLETVKTMEVGASEIARFSLRPGDVLFTEGGDADKLGRGCVWTGEIDPCLHQNHVFVVRPHPTRLSSDLLAAYARSPRGKAYFLGCAKQTTNLASINSTQLKAMPLPVPSLDEQGAMRGALKSAEDRGESEYAGLEALFAVKRAAATSLLSGQVRVTGAGR